MTEEITKYIFPFSTLAEDRVEPFLKETEKATIFCLAESERAKGGRLAIKQPPERLAYIAEVCYPFWIARFGKVRLIIDGVSTTSHTLTFSTIPDIDVFIDNANRSSKTRQAYMNFLSEHLNYFHVSDDEKSKVINGLVSDVEFLDDFASYLSEANTLKAPLSDKVVISPTLDESSISSIVEDLQNLKSRFEQEVDSLYTSMKLLDSKTRNFVKEIRNETREIKEKFNEKVESFRDSISKEVDEINKEYDEKVTELSERIEKELLQLQQEKIKLETAKEQFVNQVEHCEAEMRTCAIDKNGVGERKWREERNQFKEQLSETEAEIREIDRRIKEKEDEKTLDIIDLKSRRDARIREASKDKVDIEAERDARILMCQEEIEKFEEMTSDLIDRIDKLAKHKEVSIAEFDKLGIRQDIEEYALIYMPFYLACYQSESEKRYVHFPPSVVNSISLSVKFKGALGKAKIKQLLQPRSKRLVSLLNKFPPLMKRSAVFNREMSEACAEVNLLKTRSSRQSIKYGLDKLRDEGWFSEKEYESLAQALTENFT